MNKQLLLALCLLGCAGSGGVQAMDMSPDLTILHDGCRLLDGAASQVFTTSVQVSNTNTGNMMEYTCAATGVANTAGSEVSFSSSTNPTVCGIATPPGYVVAEKWQETVSATGAATLKCDYRRRGP